MQKIKEIIRVVLFRFLVLLFPLLGVGFIIGIIYFIQEEISNSKDIEKNARYTIGTTVDVGSVVRGTDVVIYYYKINEIRYKGYGDYVNKIIVPNGRYIVSYSAKNPKNSEILFEYEVPDSIKHSPLNGWSMNPLLTIESYFRGLKTMFLWSL